VVSFNVTLGHQIQFNCKARLRERHVEQFIVEFPIGKVTQVVGGGVTVVLQLTPVKAGVQLQTPLVQTPFPLQ
jgi:hypothetical protein